MRIPLGFGERFDEADVVLKTTRQAFGLGRSALRAAAQLLAAARKAND